MINFKKILLIIICLNAMFIQAQDLHFSQFFNSPLTTNPANTGFIPDADYRLIAHYRNQWSSVMSVPYKTTSISGDAQILRDHIDNGWMGVGAYILNDVAGSGSLKSTKMYASLAYHQMLGNSSLLSAGFNLGWAMKRIDPTALKFPDQFDGKFFDGNRPTTGIPSDNNVNYFDMQVGMNYAYFPHENVYINAGYSIQHVNRPSETFYKDITDNGSISIRHIGFLNAILKVHDNVIISPNVYFTTQLKAIEINGGVLANYKLTESGQKQLIAGLYYRHKDAVIPMLGFEINALRFTFSYDATVSSLSNFNNSRGASEFSLVKKGFYNKSAGRQSMCPQF